MIRAIIFDMDGLLIDSEPVWHQAKSDLFRAHGLQWTDTDHIQTMGVSTAGWATYVTDRLGSKLTMDQVIADILGRMEVSYCDSVPIMPGANRVLSLLAGSYTLGLASGSPMRLLQYILETAGWTRHFSEILSSDQVSRGKPAPDVYLEMMKRLQVSGSETLIFEDSANGILAGRAAGAKVIAVPNPHFRPTAEILEQADIVINSLEDFHSSLILPL